MSQLSAVTTDAEGRLVSFIEGSYLVTVRRDPVGRPLFARAVSAGKPTLQTEFKYNAGGVLVGTTGNLTSSMISILVGDGMRGGAPIGGGGGGAVSSVAGRTGSVVLTKADVDLSNVDNSADADKPISTAVATALAGKQATLASGSNIRTVNGQTLLGSSDLVVAGAVASVAGKTGAVTLVKADVGLANVDNTTDANKPVSTAQADAIAAAVAPKAPAAFTSRVLTNADDGTTLICASAQVATVNTGLVSGFGCAFKGAVSFAGTATVTDVRTTGSATPWCSLVQTGANSYDVVGTKA